MTKRDKFINDLYLDPAQMWPLDKLPYTGEFDRMLAAYNQTFTPIMSKRAFWRLLVTMRKDGKLSNKEKGNTSREKKRRLKKREEEFRGFGFGV